jgi:uridine kinase
VATSPRIITISGIAGAGKSTLVRGLHKHLRNTSVLYYDAYDGAESHWWPAFDNQGSLRLNIARWVREGGDPNQYVSIPRLALDIAKLRAGRPISMPRPSFEVQEVPAADYILFEEPFGRARFEISKLVDYSIHLDLPLDVALARTVLRQKDNGGDPIALVERHLLEGLSNFFKAQAEAGKACADLVLDATLAQKELITLAARGIQGNA